MPDSLTPQQEQAWVLAAQNGHKEAFRHLVEAHYRRVYTLCLHLLQDPDEADDAAQETFWRAYQALPRFDPERPLRPWLLTIATRYCLDCMRRRRTQPLDDLTAHRLVAPQPGPEARLLEQEAQARITALVAQLPPKDRAVILLRYWEGASYEAIAQATGMTVSAVKSRLFRARRALAQAYLEAEAHPEVDHA